MPNNLRSVSGRGPNHGNWRETSTSGAVANTSPNNPNLTKGSNYGNWKNRTKLNNTRRNNPPPRRVIPPVPRSNSWRQPNNNSQGFFGRMASAIKRRFTRRRPTNV
jgi:hypothetical protein